MPKFTNLALVPATLATPAMQAAFSTYTATGTPLTLQFAPAGVGSGLVWAGVSPAAPWAHPTKARAAVLGAWLHGYVAAHTQPAPQL